MDTATLCRDILNTARNELYLSMRFLDAALSGLSHEASPRIRATATDGEKLYYSSRYVLSAFDENPVILNRAYLHNLCHCLFSHLYLQPRENRDLWDLACDVCAESVIDSMDIPCVRRLPSLLREQTYDLLSRKLRLYTPGRLYEIFEKDVFFRQNLAALIQDFCIDTHEFWPEDAARNRSRQKSRQEEQWREIGSRTRTRMETFHRQAGDEAGNLLMHLKLSYGETLTYDRFLARFACWREVVTLNPEEFDAIYYTLGLERYGNIPLIEPLEYREEKKIQSLVLAVDTSGSVRGAPVKRFLSETFSILASSKHFFRHMQIHLLQFDTRVQDARLIQSASELPDLPDSFAVRGLAARTIDAYSITPTAWRAASRGS